ncbi:MAG TPA: hypothetical protein VFQ16_15155, partial [Burkholderiaceae bacterium]|nr:hypothetical protein [Burkholderiaceae bacterium]
MADALLDRAMPPAVDTAGLDGLVTRIEERLDALGAAVRDGDARAIEAHAQELHRALAAAVTRFTQAARVPGGVPFALRQRLARAGGLVAAQRESLARATAALDRAIDVLMPEQAASACYGAHGGRTRLASGAH